jgi:hypothetical protein
VRRHRSADMGSLTNDHREPDDRPERRLGALNR